MVNIEASKTTLFWLKDEWKKSIDTASFMPFSMVFTSDIVEKLSRNLEHISKKWNLCSSNLNHYWRILSIALWIWVYIILHTFFEKLKLEAFKIYRNKMRYSFYVLIWFDSKSYCKQILLHTSASHFNLIVNPLCGGSS